MRKRIPHLLAGAAPLHVLMLAVPAHAQPASGLVHQDAVSSGSTEVASEGFQKVEVEPAKTTDATELSVQAGGQFASGNSRLVAITSGAQFRARRANNQLSMAAAGNYSESATANQEETQMTVANVQGKTRYDRFFTRGFAGFLSLSGRTDQFQGLDLRLNLDPGLAYYFVDAEKHQLWTELGYDLQYDVRRGENVRAAMVDDPGFDRTAVRHSARGFLGYNNHLNDAVSLSTGLEYLQGVPKTEYWRLNWDVALTAAVANSLSVATTFSLRYDNHPLPDVEELDTVTAVSLVYTLL
ncbi:MAG: DUF481 domain-containing protein [Polyangiaceae bacterium]|nr:DUF481 domain-containing protein [Polyangiaceae bacterium]